MASACWLLSALHTAALSQLERAARILDPPLAAQLPKALWRSGFFEFCNGVFCGGRRKSLRCNGLGLVENTRISFFVTKIGALVKNPREFRRSAREYCVQLMHFAKQKSPGPVSPRPEFASRRDASTCARSSSAGL